MKISLNWLKEYISIDKDPEQIAEILTAIGLEVESWETEESVKGGLRGVVTAKIVECGKHPNADKLSLTKVDAGGGDLLSVVCGAPNVAAGQIVVLAQVGAELFPTGAEKGFSIKESKIRGELSQGMLCAEDELGLGESHDGIMVLPPNTKVGTIAAKYFGVTTDTVYEIGLTPNRGDATHHLGVARDLAAYLRVHEGQNIEVNLPKKATISLKDPSNPIKVHIENTTACPRYVGVSIRGVQVGDSPTWLKNRLLSLGQRPINSIVDITNYVRLEMGQPLHAFDEKYIQQHEIRVKTLEKGTKFKALDESIIELHENDLMICDGKNTPLCIAGVFGGFESGVDEKTKNVFLESALFHPSWIRKTMVRHNQRTDAAWTFEKGVDPSRTMEALERAITLIQEIAGGTVSGRLTDSYPEPIQKAAIPMRYAAINALTGVRFSKKQVHEILQALEIEVKDEKSTGFTAVVPTDKTEVTRQADVIEEILRIYGYDNVPVPTQIRTSMEVSPKVDTAHLMNRTANQLAAQGFNECQSLSLSNSDYYADFPKENLVFVHNTANQGLDVMRPQMLYSQLENVRRNLNRQQSMLRLFEFGKTYRRDADAFSETKRLSLIMVGEAQEEGWRTGQKRPDVDFFSLKAYVDSVLSSLGISNFQETDSEHPHFAYALRYGRGAQTIVEFGQVKKSLCKALDVKKSVFYADFNWDVVLKALPKKRISYAEISKFPSIRRDLALVLDKKVQFSAVKLTAQKTEKKLLKALNLFDIYSNEEQLGAGKKSYAISFLFESTEGTLKDKQIDKIMQKMVQNFEKKLGATIRS